jgi:hypothetical protein
MRIAVNHRVVLLVLIYGFLTFLTVFAIVMAAYLLAVALQDALLMRVLRLLGIAALLLLVVDTVSLVLASSVTLVAVLDASGKTRQSSFVEESSDDANLLDDAIADDTGNVTS